MWWSQLRSWKHLRRWPQIRHEWSWWFPWVHGTQECFVYVCPTAECYHLYGVSYHLSFFLSLMGSFTLNSQRGGFFRWSSSCQQIMEKLPAPVDLVDLVSYSQPINPPAKCFQRTTPMKVQRSPSKYRNPLSPAGHAWVEAEFSKKQKKWKKSILCSRGGRSF